MPLSRAYNAPMGTKAHKANAGRVSAADRAYVRRLAEANQRASHGDAPAGTLAAALDRMWRIERNMGIDPVATAQDHWPDRDSHMAYLDAVRRRKARTSATRLATR